MTQTRGSLRGECVINDRLLTVEVLKPGDFKVPPEVVRDYEPSAMIRWSYDIDGVTYGSYVLVDLPSKVVVS